MLDFFELGTQRLLVVTPQVTSIQTAYSFLKGAVLRTLRHPREKTSELELLAADRQEGENEKVSRLLARLREENPAFGEGVSGSWRASARRSSATRSTSATRPASSTPSRA